MNQEQLTRQALQEMIASKKLQFTFPDLMERFAEIQSRTHKTFLTPETAEAAKVPEVDEDLLDRIDKLQAQVDNQKEFIDSILGLTPNDDSEILIAALKLTTLTEDQALEVIDSLLDNAFDNKDELAQDWVSAVVKGAIHGSR